MKRLFKKILIYSVVMVVVGVVNPFIGLLFAYFVIGLFVATEVWRFMAHKNWRALVTFSAVLLYFFPFTNYAINYLWLVTTCATRSISSDVKVDGYYIAKGDMNWNGCNQTCVRILIEGDVDFYEMEVNPSRDFLTTEVGNYRFYRALIGDQNCKLYWNIEKYLQKEHPQGKSSEQNVPDRIDKDSLKFEEKGQYGKYCVASIRVDDLKSKYVVTTIKNNSFLFGNGYTTTVQNRFSKEIISRSESYSFTGSQFLRRLALIEGGSPEEVVCHDVKWITG